MDHATSTSHSVIAGRILNRFSKDIGCMDDMLPPTFYEMIEVFLSIQCARKMYPAISIFRSLQRIWELLLLLE